MSEKIGNVWVFAEQEGGKLADVSLELVSKGCELAATLGTQVEAVLLGNNVGHCAETLFAYGCKNVYLAEDPRLEPFTVLPYVKVIMDLIREHKPNILLFGATMKGRELAPRVASEKLAGLTADCTDLKIDDFDDKVNKKFYKDKLMQIRPAFGGNIIATIVNTWDDPQMVTVREGVMKMGTPDTSLKGTITKVDVALTAQETCVKVIERVRQERSVNLKAAQIIVAGGYGVGSKANFKLIHDLAEALGGQVGASRAAVAAGFAGYEHQVGQTGVSVRPEIYLAFGISGAVQHLSGIMNAEKIIAINNDPKAPIHEYSDYSVIADCNQFIDELIKELKGG